TRLPVPSAVRSEHASRAAIHRRRETAARTLQGSLLAPPPRRRCTGQACEETTAAAQGGPRPITKTRNGMSTLKNAPTANHRRDAVPRPGGGLDVSSPSAARARSWRASTQPIEEPTERGGHQESQHQPADMAVGH